MKECGDTDVNTIRDFGAGGKRAQLAGLWSIVPEEVAGLGPERLMTNCYSKKIEGEKKEKVDLMGEILDHGPPLLNISRPKRVL